MTGSKDTQGEFRALQKRLKPLFDTLLADDLAPRTVVVVPSLSLDEDVLQKICGISHYEERLLSLLLLLRLPRTNLIYLTSEPLSETIIDYYLHLLSGVPHGHSRKRLTLLTAHDRSPKGLTRKILDRPNLVARIAGAIADKSSAHMVCFNVSEDERELALQLDIPIFGCNPDLLHLGTKSGGRALFRSAGVPVPDGRENLHTEQEVIDALAAIKRDNPELRRAVVKLNEGFSGEGNAIFRFADPVPENHLTEWIANQLPSLSFEAADMTWPIFASKLKDMGGIVESFVEGEEVASPSVQLRVMPDGRLELLSTHDQVLGGPNGQQFLGCRFPADASYGADIVAEAMKAGQLLADAGVVGRFGIDFLSVKSDGHWRHFAIEINLRKGGTTHPYLMLQFLTGGTFDGATNRFKTKSGQVAHYVATDNLQSDTYRGLSPHDLIDIAVCRGLHFDPALQSGVVFHLIGALSEFGKLGLVAIAHTPEEAQNFYDQTIATLDEECRRRKG